MHAAHRRPPARRLWLEPLDLRCVPATLLVDDDGPRADFHTIQAAVNAAHAGDTILVAPGTYREQVTIPAALDGLTLRTKGEGHAVIQAPADLTGSKAIVHVDGADGVTVRGFDITAAGVAPGAVLAGVQVDAGGSVAVTRTRISHIGDPANGLQTGIGVLVGGRLADGATPGEATITDNTIVDYQKAGVVVVNEGSRALVADNTITGSGPNKAIGQIGVQVSDGAAAVVAGNTITGNAYTGSADATAAGVTVGNAGAVAVVGNRLAGNQVGVAAVNTTGLAVLGNRVTDSTLDGIELNGVSKAVVAGNQVTGSKRDGIALDGTTDSLILGNRATGNGEYGLAVTGKSSGNVVTLNTLRGNKAFDAFDATTGGGTAGTADTWLLNSIGKASPAGLA